MIQAGEIVPTTLVPDVPVQYAGCMPENFDRSYRGAVPAEVALAQSLNVPAVHMLKHHGVNRFYDFLDGFGMTTLWREPDGYGLTLILGGAEGTLWDITSMYANLAHIARQQRARPQQRGLRLLQGEEDATGKVVEIGPGAAWLTLKALVEVARPGDEGHWRSFTSARPIAWKTGTSASRADNWDGRTPAVPVSHSGFVSVDGPATIYPNNYSSMSDSSFKLDYLAARREIVRRLRQSPPGRVQLLTGPRQVGKTTLLLDLERRFMARAVYVACDGPEASLPGFWERAWSRAEEKARSRGNSVLLLDEVHHVSRWSSRLKGEWDRLRRENTPVHVVATGSSALRIGTGSRESLAGRFERVVLTHWSADALIRILGVSKDHAAKLVVQMGSYPGALSFRGDARRFMAYVRDAIAEPAVGRDVLALRPVRRPALLRQVFSLACTVPAQIVSLQKLQGRLLDSGALETIAHYLQLLEEAYLVAALDKFSRSMLRRRKAPPKVVVLNNALMAALDPAGIPDPTNDPVRFGTWVENACLAHAWNSGQDVSYWREEPLEIDGVIRGSWGDWAIEVKTGAFDAGELRGLLEFSRRYPRFQPLVVCGSQGRIPARRAGVAWMRWEQFLRSRPRSKKQ